MAHCLIWLIIQARPLLGPPGVCPFPIGCTQFAISQLQSFIVPVAIWHTSIRLLQCNPVWLWWHKRKGLLQLH